MIVVERLPFEMKTCSKCKQEKPLSRFYPYTDKRNGRKYYHPHCKSCHIADTRIRIDAKGKLYKRQIQHRQALKKHRLTETQYLQMVERQKNVCAICYQPAFSIPRSNTAEYLSIDHDHQTGKVRGLLCRHCNLVLGYMEDVPERLRMAAAYLEYGNN